MNTPLQKTAKETEPQRFRGSLIRSLARTLLIFTFIPLILMAGSAYLRARTLLREQVVQQMQNLMITQLNQVNVIIKTKEIRLDRLIRRDDFSTALESAL